MYQNVYQNWEHMAQSLQEPMQELMALNLATMNESWGFLTQKREELEPVLSGKSPEKFVQTQMKILSEIASENLVLLQHYTQKLSSITEIFAKEFNKNFSEMGHEVMKQNADIMKHSTHTSKKN